MGLAKGQGICMCAPERRQGATLGTPLAAERSAAPHSAAHPPLCSPALVGVHPRSSCCHLPASSRRPPAAACGAYESGQSSHEVSAYRLLTLPGSRSRAHVLAAAAPQLQTACCPDQPLALHIIDSIDSGNSKLLVPAEHRGVQHVQVCQGGDPGQVGGGRHTTLAAHGCAGLGACWEVWGIAGSKQQTCEEQCSGACRPSNTSTSSNLAQHVHHNRPCAAGMPGSSAATPHPPPQALPPLTWHAVCGSRQAQHGLCLGLKVVEAQHGWDAAAGILPPRCA